MRDLKVYDSWKEYLCYCDLGNLESEDKSLHIEEVFIREFIDQPHIFATEFEIDGQKFVYIQNGSKYNDGIIKDDGLKSFFVIYNEGYCIGSAYTSFQKAEKHLKNLKED